MAAVFWLLIWAVVGSGSGCWGVARTGALCGAEKMTGCAFPFSCCSSPPSLFARKNIQNFLAILRKLSRTQAY